MSRSEATWLFLMALGVRALRRCRGLDCPEASFRLAGHGAGRRLRRRVDARAGGAREPALALGHLQQNASRSFLRLRVLRSLDRPVPHPRRPGQS